METLRWWYPEYTMRKVITSIFDLFNNQNPDSPYSFEIAKEFRTNRDLFEEKVKYFIKKYANEGNMVKEELNSDWDFSYNK